MFVDIRKAFAVAWRDCALLKLQRSMLLEGTSTATTANRGGWGLTGFQFPLEVHFSLGGSSEPPDLAAVSQNCGLDAVADAWEVAGVLSFRV